MMTNAAGPVLCGVQTLPVYGRVSDREAARVQRVARRFGAHFLRYTGPACVCGHGCRGGCERKVWFELRPDAAAVVPELLRSVGPILLRGRHYRWPDYPGVRQIDGDFYLVGGA